MRKVLKNSPIPLHYQLKEIIQEMIENEELKPGDLLPTERELCEIQGISRMTANKAILSLVNEGLLYREQGRGTFIAEPKINQQLSELKGFTEEMRGKGYNTSSKILSFRIKEVTKNNSVILNLDYGKDLVFEIDRLMIIDNEPFVIEKVTIPENLCKNLTIEKIQDNSLYKVLKNDYGYSITNAKQTIEPVILSEEQCKLLNQKKDSLALLFRRTAYIENNVPIEYTKSFYRSDKYKYEVTLK
ncbi:GntR family transcriptional regulator [Clostridium sp. JN-9]|uniref:GntR family transcriptional regulator n=1 Tax=Clostridium sp. JN-9 TaxID=2507159 RepID=UPI000FFE127D|nr:GntR family transcriptional regulator [Clostridium sp. JN-9]QAT40355.1 GntR family transcriptional regulator [Clostridium sp. JN-9]